VRTSRLRWLLWVKRRKGHSRDRQPSDGVWSTTLQSGPFRDRWESTLEAIAEKRGFAIGLTDRNKKPSGQSRYGGMTAGLECLIEDGDRRSFEVLIVEVDDIADWLRASAIGRERYHFGHLHPSQYQSRPRPSG
jgi:hypothetical protein